MALDVFLCDLGIEGESVVVDGTYTLTHCNWSVSPCPQGDNLAVAGEVVEVDLDCDRQDFTAIQSRLNHMR